MSTKNNHDGTETIKLDSKSKRKPDINLCQCIVPVKQTDNKVWTYTPCKEVCNNVFKQGHDAKAKGQIIRAFRAGVKIIVNGKTVTPQALAKQFGWEHYLTAAPVRASRAKAAKTSKAAKATKVAAAISGKPFEGATVEFKYRNSPLRGRVTKVSAEGVEVVFQTKSGATTTKVFKPSEVKLAA
jgi:hypothetical protein